MRLETVLLIVGILVFIEPFMGIPLLWKEVLSVGLGFVIVLVSVLMRYRSRRRDVPADTPIFVERAPARAVLE